MFTGLIEEIGTVRSLVKHKKIIRAEISGTTILENTKIGDSIAINGVCQTVTTLNKRSFTFEASSTTIDKTTMSSLLEMKFVNMERAMKLNDRLGGHLIQGHVNHRARIKNINLNESMYILEIELLKEDMKYIIPEGSLAVDGISLTVAHKDSRTNRIKIRVIPQTFRETTLKFKKAGDEVNIETDMIGRYVESIFFQTNESQITIKKLQKSGFQELR
jgi:riboflavin synthase